MSITRKISQLPVTKSNSARLLVLDEVVELVNVSVVIVDRTPYTVRTARNGSAKDITFRSWKWSVTTLVGYIIVLVQAHPLAVFHDKVHFDPAKDANADKGDVVDREKDETWLAQGARARAGTWYSEETDDGYEYTCCVEGSKRVKNRFICWFAIRPIKSMMVSAHAVQKIIATWWPTSSATD
jgi:hypothetical protein